MNQVSGAPPLTMNRTRWFPGLWSCVLEQHRQRLLVSRLGEDLDLVRRTAPDRMFDRDEGITGKPQHARNVACSEFEWLGAKHRSALTELFECDAVVQTARRTAPSITDPGYQEVDLFRDPGERFRWRRSTRIGLRVDRA